MRAEAALLGGDPAGAVGFAETLMDDDPYDEGALRLVMRAHAAAGSPAAALAAYANPGKAACLLDRIDDLDTWNGVMGWHQRQRLGLLRARVLLASCDATDEAAALAREVAEDAAARGTLRYRLLAEIIEVEALALGGAVIDHARVDATLVELDALAVPEAWWLTAHVAAATGIDRWWDDAERRAARIVVAGRHAGIEGGDAVAARLDALRLTQRKR